MKNIFAICCCLFLATAAFSQKTIIDTISSKRLKEDRVISISLPASYGKEKDKKYPLLLLLDGEFMVPAFNGALEYGTYWEDIPEMIVVGINQNANNERETDTEFDKETGLPDGKGNDFFDFIGMELMPSIQKSYRIAPLKIIAGLDVTAAYANYFLYKDQPLFDAYIIISPEYPKGMEEQVPDRLSKIEKPIWYYHCVADGDLKKMTARIKKLDEDAKKVSKPTLNYRFDEFKGASHYSQVLFAIPNALYYFFSVYQPISMLEYNEKIAPLPEGYVKYLIDKYNKIEQAMGMKMKIRISDFKAIEAAIIKNKAYNEFDELAQLADKYYPKTMLADYEMAQMYEKKEMIDKAIKTYMHAYQMEPIGDLTKDMMIDKADELKASK
ncbi:alpha/beta hydrolase [Flavobacterium silvaticum]|uniref:Alpha/beta hydrolase n=1 Tax=Flavobacterium silvaticum TaxID=1852020 RepID=A0A972FLI7_9FLAO|nr:alpha/beta hydrolase-fold protein [Flavobacterium silvaticum]NMH28216.1 alpha/beta hydrolase [Flavobacterium silvaticum]